MGWFSNKQKKQSNNKPNQQSNYQPHYEQQSYFRSYSSSTSCQNDPQDQRYLLCTETINDGNNTKTQQKRILKQQSVNENFTVTNLMSDLENMDKIFNGIGKNFQQMLFPFNPIFPNFQMQFPQTHFQFNHQFPNHQYSNYNQKQQRNNQFKNRQNTFNSNYNPNYYFTSKPKDSGNVRDI